MDLSPHRVLSYVKYRWNQRVHLSGEYHAPLLALLALLAPRQAAGMRKVRVGTSRDGGYVMLDDFQGIDVALSLGIGPDVSWDFDLAQRGIPVWQYDHTISSLPKEHPLFRFEQKRIVSQGSSIHDLTLTELLQKLGRQQSVLKIDIEGDEWDVLAQLEPHLLNNCRQMVIEFHDFIAIKNPAWSDQARQALLLLATVFGVVHVHGNNLSKHIISNGLSLPDSLEVTFANRQFYKLETTEEIFPGRYDKRNNPYFPDFTLGRFQFQQGSEKT
jgi:Methyltransferase FkbM domain